MWTSTYIWMLGPSVFIPFNISSHITCVKLTTAPMPNVKTAATLLEYFCPIYIMDISTDSVLVSKSYYASSFIYVKLSFMVHKLASASLSHKQHLKFSTDLLWMELRLQCFRLMSKKFTKEIRFLDQRGSVPRQGGLKKQSALLYFYCPLKIMLGLNHSLPTDMMQSCRVHDCDSMHECACTQTRIVIVFTACLSRQILPPE